jgi:hypothetical protein
MSENETKIEKRADRTISAIFMEIRVEHGNVVAGVRATVEAAFRCGKLLIEAKSQIVHGAWGTWLDEQFPASSRTARVYMRLAEGYRNRQLPADLTIDEALTQLEPPKVKCDTCGRLIRKTRPRDCPALRRGGPEGDREHVVDEDVRDQDRPDAEPPSEWHRQRIEKTEERFASTIVTSLGFFANRFPDFRSRAGNYYGAALRNMDPDWLQGWRGEIKLARVNLRKLDSDLEAALADLDQEGDR